MKILMSIIVICIWVTADCLDIIKADTMDVNRLIKKYYYPHTDLYPKISILDQEIENKIHQKNIRVCLEELKKYDNRCNLYILTYFTKDTNLAIQDIELLRIIKAKYLSITNPILLGYMEQTACGFKSYFTKYDYFQKLIKEYNVPEIAAEEFINHANNVKRSNKVDLYISYYRFTYDVNKSDDYFLFLKKINTDPLLKLLEPYMRRNPNSPVSELSNDSLQLFITKVLKLDEKYKKIIVNSNGVIPILNDIKYGIYERWRLIQEIKKEGDFDNKKTLYNEQLQFLKTPEIKKMLQMIGMSLSEEDKQRTIYPQVVNFLDSLQVGK